MSIESLYCEPSLELIFLKLQFEFTYDDEMMRI